MSSSECSTTFNLPQICSSDDSCSIDTDCVSPQVCSATVCVDGPQEGCENDSDCESDE